MNDTKKLQKIFEQLDVYTPTQLRILYCDGYDVDAHITSARSLYIKAMERKDYDTILLLHSKYDLTNVLRIDMTEELPDKDYTKETFDSIYASIKEIDSNYDKRQILQRKRERARNGSSRRYGGKHFRGCFSVTEDEIIFDTRKYLFETTSDNVKTLALALGLPKERLPDLYLEIIPWILEQHDYKLELLKILRNTKEGLPIPLEDIVDMEEGKILML